MEDYSKEELEAINYIYGKDKDNKDFTKEELNLISNADLKDNKLVNLIKMI